MPKAIGTSSAGIMALINKMRQVVPQAQASGGGASEGRDSVVISPGSQARASFGQGGMPIYSPRAYARPSLRDILRARLAAQRLEEDLPEAAMSAATGRVSPYSSALSNPSYTPFTDPNANLQNKYYLDMLKQFMQTKAFVDSQPRGNVRFL